MESRPKGAYRKDFYAIFEGMVGRKMTDQEHAFLKAMMLNYLKEHGTTVMASNEVREHTFTCKKCGGVTKGKGKSFKSKMRKIKDPQ